jgi:hypothetical protein
VYPPAFGTAFQVKLVDTGTAVALFAGELSVAVGNAAVVKDQTGDAACLLLSFGSMLVTYQ